jgi:hypothetical protein
MPTKTTKERQHRASSGVVAPCAESLCYQPLMPYERSVSDGDLSCDSATPALQRPLLSSSDQRIDHISYQQVVALKLLHVLCPNLECISLGFQGSLALQEAGA